MEQCSTQSKKKKIYPRNDDQRTRIDAIKRKTKNEQEN